MNEDLSSKLDELISVIRADKIPESRRWVDLDGIAAMLNYSKRHVCERVVCLPDFPKPVRISGVGLPRWKLTEVDAWIERQRRAA